MNSRCENCLFFHRLKHNFEQGKGFKESYACDVLLYLSDGSKGWIQETRKSGMCEFYTGKENADEIDNGNKAIPEKL